MQKRLPLFIKLRHFYLEKEFKLNGLIEIPEPMGVAYKSTQAWLFPKMAV